MTITGRYTAVVEAPPAAVFRTLTDLDGLPSWNKRMVRVVERAAQLEPGAEWIVEFEVYGRRWRSRSILDELDARARRFQYRSRTDDGNPSEASWAWVVEEHPEGARVTVAWSLDPVTFWRRVLLGRIRARQLARTEVPASLAALASAAQRATATG